MSLNTSRIFGLMRYMPILARLEGSVPTFGFSTKRSAVVDENALLPETIPEIILNAALSYERPWDRFAVERAYPRLKRMNIRDLRFIWGEVQLTGSGSFDVTPAGFVSAIVTDCGIVRPVTPASIESATVSCP